MFISLYGHLSKIFIFIMRPSIIRVDDSAQFQKFLSNNPTRFDTSKQFILTSNELIG